MEALSEFITDNPLVLDLRDKRNLMQVDLFFFDNMRGKRLECSITFLYDSGSLLLLQLPFPVPVFQLEI